MWKNNFSIDVFGSKGSLHMSGLNKWGKSILIKRKRVFPSGVPKEKRIVSSDDDKTWFRDIEFFENLIKKKKTSYENDLHISECINSFKSMRKG